MPQQKESNIQRGRYTLLLVLCLTLGLAPFSPEPHIVGKIRWVAGGGHGMRVADVFDLVLHGLPWALLIARLVADLTRRARR